MPIERFLGSLLRPLWLGLTLLVLPAGAQVTNAPEFRALWADAFHDGFMTAGEVTQLVADARAGHFNAVIVQVRKRGDAYYNSNFEPKATDVSPQSFDPLADLIAKAHNTNTGPRIEIHAWVVSYNIWNNESTLPSQTNHPYRLHPDWLTQNSSGTTWDGGNYAFDPGHPDVQRHTFHVCMDIVSRYDVDGLNFDYIRYAGNTWGYNSNAVARFNARFNRSGQPATTDPDWLQFRRDQVSALVRKVYLHAAALKPQVKISADTICFAPGVTTDTGWTNSAAAYTSVLQDWRAWMEEGILDISIPMAYFNQGGSFASAWTNWNTFAKDRRYNRHTAIGPGIYLNSMSNALFQMRYTRRPSPSGNFADGLCGYSYAVPTSDSTPRATFLAALTTTNTSRLYETNAVPLFATNVPTPVMPWKTAPTRGHLKGFAYGGTTNNPLDGASLTLTGPTNRALLSDATGFYGAVDLPPGNYSLTAVQTGFVAFATNLTVTAGTVVTRDFLLSPSVPVLPPNITDVRAAPSTLAAIITWRTTNASSSQVEYGLTTNLGLATPEDARLVTNHTVLLLLGLQPGTNYHFAVVSRAGTNTSRSDGWSFSTTGELILDNPEAGYTGSWSTGTSSLDKFRHDYRFVGTSTNGSTASATFRPLIPTRGRYDVDVWHPQGANRSTNAPVTVVYSGASLTVRVNQEINGGQWLNVAANLLLPPGTNNSVRVNNNTSDDGQVVLADGVRFIYRADQDKPAGPAVPDWWSWHHFGSNVNAALDHDLDGFPAWAEYLAGTDPTNTLSRLRFDIEKAPGLRVVFSPFLGERTYRLQRLTGPGSWQTLTNAPVPLPDSRGAISILGATNAVSLFRLQIDWAP
jgi:uncharacterized lipoprotein YddW (UPF0748 family)